MPLGTVNKKDVLFRKALDYARPGWPVLAAYPVVGGRCTCPRGAECDRPGAHPLDDADATAATTDQLQIWRWWQREPGAGILLATGGPARLCALRTCGEGGRQALAELEREVDRLPHTPLARCGMGDCDYCYYFRAPAGRAVPPSTVLAGGRLHLYGDGGLVPVPPSKDGLGEAWTWKVSPDHAPLARAPAWLLDLVEGHLAAEAAPAPDPTPAAGTPTDATEDAAPSADAERNVVDDEVADPVPPHNAEEAKQSDENSISELPAHPAAELFPLQAEGPDYQALKEDIAANGLRVPVLTYQGKVLDGRRRLRACRELGVQAPCREWDGRGSPVGLVLSLNVARRHLTESQRAMVAARAKPLFEAEAAARMRAGRAADPPPNSEQGAGEVAAQAAARLNVGRGLVYQAQHVLRHGVPELQRAVETGQVRLAAAAELADLPQAEQSEAVAGGPKEVKAQAAERRRAKKLARRADATPERLPGGRPGVKPPSAPVLKLRLDAEDIALALAEALGPHLGWRQAADVLGNARGIALQREREATLARTGQQQDPQRPRSRRPVDW
jgi:Bifunctional DNA primase/polymerase, N-terminal